MVNMGGQALEVEEVNMGGHEMDTGRPKEGGHWMKTEDFGLDIFQPLNEDEDSSGDKGGQLMNNNARASSDTRTRGNQYGWARDGHRRP